MSCNLVVTCGTNNGIGPSESISNGWMTRWEQNVPQSSGWMTEKEVQKYSVITECWLFETNNATVWLAQMICTESDEHFSYGSVNPEDVKI